MPKVEAHDIDITPDPNASTTQPVQRAPSEEDLDITPHAPEEEDPGLLAKGLDIGGRALDYAGGVARVGLANSPAASMADMLQAYLRKKPLLNQPGDIGRALVGKAPRSAEYMDRAGIPEGASVSDLVPGAFTEEPGFTMKAKKGGMLDPSMRGAVGGVVDMALDPLSYLGITELAKGGGALAKIANGLRRVASPVGTSEGALANAADKAAVRHLRPTPKVAQVLGPDKLQEIGRDAIDSGAIKFGQKADSTAARLGDLKDESGSLIGDIVNASDKTANPVEIAQKFQSEVIDPLKATSGNEQLISHLEGQKQSFLDKYSPGHDVAGRDPSLPTTITRSSKFVPKAVEEEPVGGAIQKIGETPTTITRNSEFVMPQRTPPNGSGPFEISYPAPLTASEEAMIKTLPPEAQAEVREALLSARRPKNPHGGFTGEETAPANPVAPVFSKKKLTETRKGGDPINAFLTPEAEAAAKDPFTKEVVERRIEQNPAPKGMTPAQVEAQKRVEQDKINYLSDPKIKQKAQMNWASILKKQTEGMIDDPAFKAAKKAYGNQAAAEMMAGRTAALTDGGTGLMGHMTDLAVEMPALQALIHGNPTGAGLAAARGVTKGRIGSSAAITLDKLSKLAGSKYAPAIDAFLRRKEIDKASPAPRGNVWSNALQSQNGGNQ